MNIDKLSAAVRWFKRIDPECNAVMMQVLLFVAQRGACTQKDIEANLRMSNASVSRLVSWWSVEKKHGTPGAGCLERRENPKDRRYKLVSLTPKGEEVIRLLLGA